ncbi:MAG TPA: FAD-dependent oxidoreductase [Gemmatimonadaceae bacterium]|nr:FAD-dependent oxidoreductase [Gemmatimonadaceae bacterium]
MTNPDAVVIGGGLIGLCAAAAMASRGLSVTILASSRPGEASPAAAGMLAPSVERSTGGAHDFAVAARDRYPAFLSTVEERTGIRVPLNRLGILQVALSERGVRGLKKSAAPTTKWLDSSELRHLEPALHNALGAAWSPDDGAVDNVVLLQALETLADSDRRITRIRESAASVASEPRSGVVVLTVTGARIEAGHAVLAAGCWTSLVTGAMLAKSVTPARGQLVSYPAQPLRHVVYGPRGYVVPRGSTTIGGSTMENSGFDSSTTEEGIARVRSAAEEICPALFDAAPVTAWAGLRPVTPDMLPLLGADPANPALIYACGHSRNGVLMAPLTGDVVADLVTGSPLSHDLSQFRPARF